MIAKTNRWLQQLGPGLITGAADDDPSGIATYSQAGAQFGYQLGWTLVLTYPLMVGIQMVSARMGRVTGHGLASNVRSHFPRPVLYAVVVMLVVANTINIAADIAAMGEALRLVAGGPTHIYAIAVRYPVPEPAGIPALPGLRPLPEVADTGAACLRCGRVHDRGAVARSRHGPSVAQGHLERAGADGHRRRLRHDDQPLPVLLAGGAGGRGAQRGSGRHGPQAGPRRRAFATCTGSRSTRISAWDSPT